MWLTVKGMRLIWTHAQVWEGRKCVSAEASMNGGLVLPIDGSITLRVLFACVTPSYRHCSTAKTLSVTLLIPEGKFAFHLIRRSTQDVASWSTSFLLTGTKAGQVTCPMGLLKMPGQTWFHVKRDERSTIWAKSSNDPAPILFWSLQPHSSTTPTTHTTP